MISAFGYTVEGVPASWVLELVLLTASVCNSVKSDGLLPVVEYRMFMVSAP